MRSPYLYMYYEYVEFFKQRPVTLDELFTGICFILTKSELRELYKE